MNAVTPFAFEDHLVRTVMHNDAIWFVGIDVCHALGIKKPHSSLNLLNDDEKGSHSMGPLGGGQEAIIISEPGVYRLVFRSRKPEAERFKHWLAHEVIPQIRRTGKYAPGGDDPARAHDIDPGASLSARVAAVHLAMRLFGKPRARLLWAAVGLPSVGASGSPNMVQEGRDCLARLLNDEHLDLATRLRTALDGGDRKLLADMGLKADPAGDGVWIANNHPTIARLYAGTDWVDGRWRFALRELPGARISNSAMRFGAEKSRATWIPAQLVQSAD